MTEVTLKNYYTSKKRGGKKQEKVYEKLPTEDKFESSECQSQTSSEIVKDVIPDNLKSNNCLNIQKGGKVIVDTKATSKPKKGTRKNASKSLKSEQIKLDKYFKNEKVSYSSEKNENVGGSSETTSPSKTTKQSPKRTLPPAEESTPTKKKLINVENKDICPVGSLKLNSPVRRRLITTDTISPSKSTQFLSPSKKSFLSPEKLTESERLDLLISQSRSKLHLSPKLDELKKSLVIFSEAASKIKEFQTNRFKITEVASSSPSVKVVKPSSPTKQYAYERFQHLVTADSLILPVKYKLLFEMFYSMDTVVSILNNRKERITYTKVQEGVQQMTKRNFNKSYLGQIVTVWPLAYNIVLEKNNTKKAGYLPYDLLITPNMPLEKGKKKKAFIPMNPQCLIDRKNEFRHQLLVLVKQHHQEFLHKQNITNVPDDKIMRWHPKFALDSVPDVKASALPEPPESKVSTAKDVLNKVKGTFSNKIEKALQSVVDESQPLNVVIDVKDTSSTKTSSKSALKGICTDILERVRARESAMVLETMTRGPDETKRLTMMERLPKMVNIIWHFFISERRSAVSLDTAVEKIIHSFDSLLTPDDIKEHMKLITEQFPGWLAFIEIRKGTFIKIDKSRSINDMLANFKY